MHRELPRHLRKDNGTILVARAQQRNEVSGLDAVFGLLIDYSACGTSYDEPAVSRISCFLYYEHCLRAFDR
jgi:hypothetical protein